MNYWIFKSEPDEYSIDQLASEPRQTARWDGIRNYQARNNLRDKVKQGDLVLFYHSSCRNTGIVGSMRVVKAAYADPDQFDPGSKYHDPKSTRAVPLWYCVDVRLVEKFPALLSTKTLKANDATSDLVIFRQGRLSIAPLSAAQWDAVQALKQHPDQS